MSDWEIWLSWASKFFLLRITVFRREKVLCVWSSTMRQDFLGGWQTCCWPSAIHHGLKLCSMMSMSAMPFLPLNIRMKHWIESLFWMRRHGAIGNTDQPTLYTLCGFGIDSKLTGLSPALFKEPPSSDAHVDWPLTGFCQLLHCTLASSCDRPAVYAKAKADFSNQWGHRY